MRSLNRFNRLETADPVGAFWSFGFFVIRHCFVLRISCFEFLHFIGNLLSRPWAILSQSSILISSDCLRAVPDGFVDIFIDRKNTDETGGNQYVLANVVQGNDLEYPPSLSKLIVDLEQELQAGAVHTRHRFAVEDDLRFVLVHSLVEHGFDVFTVLMGQGLFGGEDGSGAPCRGACGRWLDLYNLICHRFFQTPP